MLVQNVRNAEMLGFEVGKLGAMPVIPHKNTENFNGLFNDDFWIEGTKELMRRCDAAITVEALGLSYGHSKGSLGEVVEMRIYCGKPFFHSLGDLRFWLLTNK
jgi:hypothetical protein